MRCAPTHSPRGFAAHFAGYKPRISLSFVRREIPGSTLDSTEKDLSLKCFTIQNLCILFLKEKIRRKVVKRKIKLKNVSPCYDAIYKDHDEYDNTEEIEHVVSDKRPPSQIQHLSQINHTHKLRAMRTIVIVHTLHASRDTRVSYR